jgi:CheY-like chemotaxis protein
MPGGGTISIETGNTVLDQSYLDSHPEAQLGPNVVLSVTDTGEGMDAETMARAFEPFFSTKPIGAGTGLGLATVHGIVKQSGGSIWAYSEPGIGTTFKIYLPATSAVSSADVQEDADDNAEGTETILIAEDEAILRPLLAKMLESHGYATIVAGNTEEAIEIVKSQGDEIDLLLTDLIMPGMTGRELADRVRTHSPEIRVVFMSGYAGDTVTRSGALELDAAFVEKPFSAHELGRKVRETLDGTRAVS